LTYGIETILAIKCEIPSLCFVVEFLLDSSPLKHIVELKCLDEEHQDAYTSFEAYKNKLRLLIDPIHLVILEKVTLSLFMIR
jgi:hypothetical protein